MAKNAHRHHVNVAAVLLAGSLAIGIAACGDDDPEDPDEIEQDIRDQEDQVEDQLDEKEEELRN
jgi:hypothetical protein